MRKSMSDFIRENRAELEAAINRVLSSADIREWIANDEGLYSWARSEGVRV